MYTIFRQTLVYIVYAKSKELCQLNFAYEMYINVCRNVVYILYTNILYISCIQKFVKIWDTFCIQTFCIHFVCINSDVPQTYIINIMYTICIQNSYKMYLQIIVCRMDPLFRHILTHLLCTSELIIANN